MGTRVLEYGINVLAGSGRFSVDESESESQRLNHSFQITGFDKYQNSTNMPADQHNNLDSIRNTMRLHDHIFKQQVKELHRLYNVQKILMEEMKKNNKNHSNKEKRVREDHGEMSPTERSGSCSNEIQTMKVIKTKPETGLGFDLERRRTPKAAIDQEDVSTGVISRLENTTEEQEQEEDEIELTLSIGRRSKKKLKKEQDSSTPTSTKHPHWLFNGFSLNKTSSSSSTG